MEKLRGEVTFLSQNGQEKQLVLASGERNELLIGSNPVHDIRIYSEAVESTHCKIYRNDNEKILIQNFSKANPILVNGEIVEGKKLLKSGDVITIVGKNMRWELKSDAKRRTAALTKEERKLLKHKFIKTNKRITIHDIAYDKLVVETPKKVTTSNEVFPKEDKEVNKSSEVEEEKEEEEQELENKPAEECSIKELNSSIPAILATDKENAEKTPSKACNLNLSGLLQTSYTPPVKMTTRSVSKTPYNSPMRSPLVRSSTAKNILNNSLNVLKAETPTSANKLNRSMYLVDLTTPYVQRAELTSTPKVMMNVKSSPRTVGKTPKTVGKTPLRNQALLKSALKNSSIKKNVQGNLPNITPIVKGKVLFESPLKNNNSSSIIEVSSISFSSGVEEINSSHQSSVNDDDYNKGGEKEFESIEQSKEQPHESSLIIGDEKNQQKINETGDVIKETTIEKEFNRISEEHSSLSSEVGNSLFDQALNNVPIEAIENFDKLIEDEEETPVENKNVETEKAEIVMKIIEEARLSLATEPNITNQVLSSRYSDVTPNDSLVNSTSNISQKYDVATPKISILDAVSATRKSELETRLTISPVSRLSVANDATEIVENYQLNNNNSKSLRSTRKRIGSAMASLHNISQSTSGDITFDGNVSLNSSTIAEKGTETDLNNQSLAGEESNILSLDEPQPPFDTSNKENVHTDIMNNSIKFFEYSEVDENNDGRKIIFEISNENNGLEELEEVNTESESESSSSDEEEEEEEVEEEMLDENEDFVEEEHLDITDSEKQVTNRFRLSEQDLQEDGINPLDISKGDEDDIPATQEICQENDEDSKIPEDDVNISSKNQIDASNSAEQMDDEEIPATQDIVAAIDETIEDDTIDDLNNFEEIPSTPIFEPVEENAFLANKEDAFADTSSFVAEKILEETVADTNSLVAEKILEETVADTNSLVAEKILEETVADTSSFVAEKILEETVADTNSLVAEKILEETVADTNSLVAEKILEETVTDTNSLVAEKIQEGTVADTNSFVVEKILEETVADTNSLVVEKTVEETVADTNSFIADTNSFAAEKIVEETVADANSFVTEKEADESLAHEEIPETQQFEFNNESNVERLQETTEIIESIDEKEEETAKHISESFDDNKVQNIEEKIDETIEEITENASIDDSQNEVTDNNESIVENVCDEKIESLEILTTDEQQQTIEEAETLPEPVQDSFVEEIVEEIELKNKTLETASEKQPEISIKEENQKEEDELKLQSEEIIEDLISVPSADEKDISEQQAERSLEHQKSSLRESNSSSVIEISSSTIDMSNVEEVDSVKESTRTSSFIVLDKIPQPTESQEEDLPSHNDDVRELLDSITSVLDSDNVNEENKEIEQIEDAEVVTNELVKQESTLSDALTITSSEETIAEKIDENRDSDLIASKCKDEPIEVLEENNEEAQHIDSTELAMDSSIENDQMNEDDALLADEVVIKQNESTAVETIKGEEKSFIDQNDLDEIEENLSVHHENDNIDQDENSNEPNNVQEELEHEEIPETQPMNDNDEKNENQDIIEATQETEDEIINTPEEKDEVENEIEMNDAEVVETHESVENVDENEDESLSTEAQNETFNQPPVDKKEILNNLSTENRESPEKVLNESQQQQPITKKQELPESEDKEIRHEEDILKEANQESNSSESAEQNKETLTEEMQTEVKKVEETDSIEEVPVEKEITTEKEKKSKKPKKELSTDEKIKSPEKEIAEKLPESTLEPQTPSRKRAKKLNYLELASGSPARTPRRTRKASNDERPIEITKSTNIPNTIAEENIEKEVESKEAIVETAVKTKSSGRSRKVEQLKEKIEEVSTPSKRAKRGVTPIQTPSVPEPPKRGRKRKETQPQQEDEKSEKHVTEESEKSDEVAKESESLSHKATVAETISISSNENVQIEEEPKKVEVAKKGRGRQPKVVEEVKIVEESEQNEHLEEPTANKKGRSKKLKVDMQQEEKTVQNSEAATPIKRGRGRKVVEKEEITEKISEVVEEKVQSPEQPAKKRGRAAKTEKVTESHAEIKDENKEQQVEEKHVPTKRGRKGKAEAVPEKIAEVIPEKLETTVSQKSTKRGTTPVQTPTPEPPKGRGRKHKIEEVPETEKIVEDVVPTKRGRKAKEAAIEVEKPQSVEEEKVEELSQTKKAVEEAAPAKRGRKAKEIVVEEEKSQPVEEEKVPKRGVRKGKAVENVVSEVKEETTTSKRGRKGKTEAVPEKAHEEPSQEEQPAVVTKKGRGRKIKTEEASQEQPVIEDSSQNTQNEEKVAPKRGRKAKVAEEKEQKTEEPAQVQQEEPVAKKPRGRQPKHAAETVKVKETTPSVDETEPKTAKTPKSKKTVAAKHVTIVTPTSMSAQSKEKKVTEEPTTKRATKRQATVATEEPVTTKRSMRNKK